MKIYYNPKCSKCRIAKRFLEENGEEAEIIEYLKDTPTSAELKEILSKLGMRAEEIVRKKEEKWQEFSGEKYTEDELVNILVNNPVLIQRPIIVKGDNAVVGRSEEKLKEIVGE